MKLLKSVFFLVLFASCSSHMSHTASYGPSMLEEIRIAMLDIKQAYDKQQLGLELLEEKFAQLEKGRGGTQMHELLLSLEKKLANLEKSLEKTRLEMNQFTSHATQTTNSLLQYRDKIEGLEKNMRYQEERLGEVIKLKHTLNSISKAVGTSIQPGSKIHKVRSGDSLEKIARKYDTSIDTIKELNSLSGSTIFIDQELKIPD